MSNKSSTIIFLLLSFLEGSAVMLVELMGAKMIAPFFGSSLYVWAGVLGVTLGGLAGGYFTGGLVSRHRETRRNLMALLLLASLFIMLMPFSARQIMILLMDAGLITGILISCFVFLFPPLFLLGMVSPVIIRMMADKSGQPGRSAGLVYGISTAGGIMATFLTGFWIIPQFGLTVPCVAAGIVLGIWPFAELIRKRYFFSVIFLILAAYSVHGSLKKSMPGLKVHYHSEGLYGQIVVADLPSDSSYSRVLLLNKMPQTIFHPALKKQPYSDYVLGISAAASSMPRGSRALLLGLGGGAVAGQFSKLGFRVDAVEIDPRMEEVARAWFSLPPAVNVITGDARHYLNNCTAKYDIVVMDIFKGEEQPSHVMSYEALQEVKRILNKEGLLLVNFNGYLRGEEGKGTRSVYKTLHAAGFHVELLPTPGTEAERNTIFIASYGKKEEWNYRLTEIAADTSMAIHEFFYDTARIDTSDAAVITDDRPLLEKLNSRAASAWRRAGLRGLQQEMTGRGIPLFE